MVRGAFARMAALAVLMLSAMAQAQKWLAVPVPEDPMAQAQWIWVRPAGGPVPSASGGATGTFVFGTTFDAGRVTRARLRFTADNEAVVRLNGREVAKSTEWSQITETDATALVHAGLNRIEASVTNPSVSGATMNPGGLLLALELEGSDGNRVVVSNALWSCAKGEVVAIGPAGIAPWGHAFRDGISPIFRKEFTVERVPKRAEVEVVGLGHYQLFVNGKRVGDAAVNQPWTQFDKTITSKTFDLAPYLAEGKNCIAVMLGNGFFSVARPPARRYAKGDAMPDYAEGHPIRLWMKGFVSTDETWRWSKGPVTLSHVFAGEDYDARLVERGWLLAGFQEGANWKQPSILPKPNARIVRQDWPDFEPVETFQPVRIAPQPKGGWAYIFPQNCSATLRLVVEGPRGATVRFQMSEVIQPNGDVEQLNLWNADALTTYTLAGSGPETYENLFFYHGGQFVGVQGAVPVGQPNPQGLPVLHRLELVHVRTNNPVASHLLSSKPLYNRTVNLIDWAMRSNMGFVLTDCPHREKLGWLECAHLLADSFAYRYDCRDWFRKICRDMRDAQLASGRVLTVAPRYLMRPDDDMYAWTVEWGAASVFLPWKAYRWYGDTRFLSENIAMMERFVDHVASQSKDGIAPGSLGDWYDYGHGQPPGPSRYTDTRLTSTAMLAMCAHALAQAERILGRNDRAARYEALLQATKTAFLREFYDPVAKAYKNNGSVQTGSAMALCAGLVPESDRGAVLEGMVKELESRGYQQTSGDVGHLFLIRALAEAGRSDVLHRVYSREGLGSYGGILAKGLTAMPETWDAITAGSNSLNHCMLGHAMEWFYGYVLGLRQAPGSVGWRDAVFEPVPGETDHASGWLQTPQGKVVVSWKRTQEGLRLAFEVPQGMRLQVAGKAYGAGAYDLIVPQRFSIGVNATSFGPS